MCQLTSIMLGPRWRRTAAAFLAPLLLVTVVRGEGAHICPVHHPLLAQLASSAGHHGASNAHADHHGTSHQATRCCCADQACAAAAVAPPAPAVRLAPEISLARAEQPLPAYIAPYARAPYLLPFANGPPAPPPPAA